MLHRALWIACVLVAWMPAQASPDGAAELAALVEGLSERGLHEMTVTEAGRFLSAHGTDARASLVRYRLASALLQLGRDADARAHFRALLPRDDFPFRAEAHLRLGQIALAAGDLDEAAAVLAPAVTLRGGALAVPATFLLAELALRRDDAASASARYTQVLAADPDGEFARDARAGLAWCATRNGDPEGALKHSGRVLADGADGELAREMHFLQGEAHRQAGRPAEAAKAYARVDGGPHAEAALRGTALARTALGDVPGTLAAWRALLAQHPQGRGVAEATLQLGMHLVLAGEHAEAEEVLGRPSVRASAEARYWRARAHADAGRDAAALTQLDAADAARPEGTLAAHIASLRGDVFTRQGRAQDAAAAYARAGSHDALHAAAVSHFNAGDATAAASIVLPLLAQRPDDLPLVLTAAEVLFALERFAEAEPHFAVLARNGDPAARARCASRRAWCRYLVGDARGAAPLFGAVVAEHPAAPEAPEALFMQGRAADEAGDGATALAAWDTLVDTGRDAPGRDEALFAMARLRPGAEGVSALQRLADEHPESAYHAAALWNLAERLAQLERFAEAETSYGALIARHPEHELVPGARYGRAWALTRTGRFDEAAAVLAPFAARADDGRRGRGPGAAASRADDGSEDAALRASALELLVWCEAEGARPAAAEDAWRQFVAADVDEARRLDAARRVAHAWVAAGRPERGRAVLGELGAGSLGAAAHTAAAYLALDAGDVDGAETSARAALQRDPSHGEAGAAAFHVAEARAAAGDDARALALHALAASVPGEHRDGALYKAGFGALRAGQAEQAATALATLVHDHPRSSLLGESLFLLGEAYVRLERWDDAVPPLQRVVTEMPRHAVIPKARFRLGRALCELGRHAEAEPVLADLLRDAPDFANILESELWRGRALAALGRDRSARAAWQRVVTDDPGVLGARARIERGRLDRAQGQTEAALSEFLKVAVLYAHADEVAEALLLAGDCLADLGDVPRAADRYREVLDKHPDTPAAQLARERLAAH